LEENYHGGTYHAQEGAEEGSPKDYEGKTEGEKRKKREKFQQRQ
jgi:hypothetical protein